MCNYFLTKYTCILTKYLSRELLGGDVLVSQIAQCSRRVLAVQVDVARSAFIEGYFPRQTKVAQFGGEAFVEQNVGAGGLLYS